MRAAALALALVSIAAAQFKSTVPLVVAPTTVTGPDGRFVDGLTTEDLILYDNNVPQRIQMDWTLYPISLVVAVQAGANAGAVIDKLGGSGILFTELLAAAEGETAVLSFSDRVHVRQDFTDSPGAVTRALRTLRKEGSGACILDAASEALTMLEGRPAARRRVLLLIAEKHDRGSAVKLEEVVARMQRLNTMVLWLTWSPFLEPFTVKPKTAEDLKPEAERIKGPQCALCPQPDDTPVPADLGPGGLIYGLGELFRMRKPDLARLLTEATGGRALSFVKKNALENAIRIAGEEVHRQYLLSFQPKGGEPGQFRALRVVVKDRPELRARTRAGYWTVQ